MDAIITANIVHKKDLNSYKLCKNSYSKSMIFKTRSIIESVKTLLYIIALKVYYNIYHWQISNVARKQFLLEKKITSSPLFIAGVVVQKVS